MKTKRLAIVCGGPSQERGISMNSARSVVDHLNNIGIEILVFYFDMQLRVYQIPKHSLYSNTPSDFDFKIQSVGHSFKNLDAWLDALEQIDLVFPVIHGAFGEDGKLQALLESRSIPFVGSCSKTCQEAFRKTIALDRLKEEGFVSRPRLYGDHTISLPEVIHFFHHHDVQKAIVKPAIGGSSIHIYVVNTPEEAHFRMTKVYEEVKDEVILEPFIEGTEFTTIILQDFDGRAISLLPTDIEIDYSHGQIFDFRRKYLPTCQSVSNCLPRSAYFPNAVLDEIRRKSEAIFQLFGMHDFARIDGWVLENQDIYFSDLNMISGMEQNSFIFQQASLAGLDHQSVLLHIINTALKRYGKETWSRPAMNDPSTKKTIPILLGGDTSERHVSLMSGTNVWLKLMYSEKYHPVLYFKDKRKCIWELPYPFALRHTTDEIEHICHIDQDGFDRLNLLLKPIRAVFGVHEPVLKPYMMSFDAWIQNVIKPIGCVFNALHGGFGENGTLQKILTQEGIAYQGSKAQTSELCSDKWLTIQRIMEMDDPDISVIPTHMAALYDLEDPTKLWDYLVDYFGTHDILVKPRHDGCSTGIVRLSDAHEFNRYLHYIHESFIPPHTFIHQGNQFIEMPTTIPAYLLFQPFVSTDTIRVDQHRIDHERHSGQIELTVGVLQDEMGVMKAMRPSITVVSRDILSVEEKFQGGTGVNITPPPEEIMSSDIVECVQRHVEKLCQILHIRHYARFDLFAHIDTGEIQIIEINTLPALTPSTVLYHQALDLNPPMSPYVFLSYLCDLLKTNID